MSDQLTSSSQPPAGPEANLGFLFRLAHQRFRGALDKELEEVGLSAQEFGILSVFETRPELSTSELARVAQVTRQTMHTAVLGLEAAGLIERKAQNRRVVLICPTRRGLDRLSAATKRVRAVEHSVFEGLSHDEQRVVRTWLAEVAAMPAVADVPSAPHGTGRSRT